MLKAKVGIMPGSVKELVLPMGSTVEDALRVGELSSEGYEIMVNGAKATLATALTDNAYVILTAMTKGN